MRVTVDFRDQLIAHFIIGRLKAASYGKQLDLLINQPEKPLSLFRRE